MVAVPGAEAADVHQFRRCPRSPVWWEVSQDKGRCLSTPAAEPGKPLSGIAPSLEGLLVQEGFPGHPPGPSLWSARCKEVLGGSELPTLLLETTKPGLNGNPAGANSHLSTNPSRPLCRVSPELERSWKYREPCKLVGLTMRVGWRDPRQAVGSRARGWPVFNTLFVQGLWDP